MNELDSVIANLINSLVKDEWEAVDGYNSAIATLSDYDDERAKKIIKVLEDIRDEEYVHIGQLESCLSMTNGDPTEDIDEGSEEGFEQLELPEDDEGLDHEEANDLQIESLTEGKKGVDFDEVVDEINDCEMAGLGYDDIIDELMDRFGINKETAERWFQEWAMNPEYGEEDDLEVESLNETKIKATGNMVEIPIDNEPKSSLSEKEMKKIICTMIDKYDASEEETFDEIQSSDPTITRKTVHKLYKMCNRRNESLEREEKSSFDEMWEELDKMED